MATIWSFGFLVWVSILPGDFCGDLYHKSQNVPQGRRLQLHEPPSGWHWDANLCTCPISGCNYFSCGIPLLFMKGSQAFWGPRNQFGYPLPNHYPPVEMGVCKVSAKWVAYSKVSLPFGSEFYPSQEALRRWRWRGKTSARQQRCWGPSRWKRAEGGSWRPTSGAPWVLL